MKLANIAGRNSASAPAIVIGDSVVDISEALAGKGQHWRDLGEAFAAHGLDVLRSLEPWAKAQADAGKGVPVAQAKFLSPVLNPPRILAVAANYRAHVLETKVIEDAAREETAPWFFDKPLASLCAHNEPIRLPSSLARKIDWEAELTVVIGKTARKVSVENALDYVLGYTIVNDISAREMNVPERTKIRDRDKFHDWLHGKWFDTFCPIGPWIVTADEIPDPSALQISLSVNDQRYQHAPTSDMLFTTAELISFASHITTLEPGSLIATGTPSGVGKATGRFLTQGDSVSITISKIGTLTNPVIADA
jgi:2-keto-4-pentenoate hydratase/2-oxohepta-3-ene-1,7-dioic acid hydratase in catechol pathway